MSVRRLGIAAAFAGALAAGCSDQSESAAPTDAGPRGLLTLTMAPVEEDVATALSGRSRAPRHHRALLRGRRQARRGGAVGGSARGQGRHARRPRQRAVPDRNSETAPRRSTRRRRSSRRTRMICSAKNRCWPAARRPRSSVDKARTNVRTSRARLRQAEEGLRSARDNLENAVILAPFDGIINSVAAGQLRHRRRRRGRLHRSTPPPTMRCRSRSISTSSPSSSSARRRRSVSRTIRPSRSPGWCGSSASAPTRSPPSRWSWR